MQRQVADAMRLDEDKQTAVLRERQNIDKAMKEWDTFLSTETKSQSVQQFLELAPPVIRLDSVSNAFGVPISIVEERIRQLIREGRLSGYFSTVGERRFVVISSEKLEAIASSIKKKGCVTLRDVTEICEQITFNNKNG